jgi:hypothetical protein
VECTIDEAERFAVRFFSADWSTWSVLTHIQTRWPDLTIKVKIDYG